MHDPLGVAGQLVGTMSGFAGQVGFVRRVDASLAAGGGRKGANRFDVRLAGEPNVGRWRWRSAVGLAVHR